MVRKAAEMKRGIGKKSNGHYNNLDLTAHEMDLDLNGNENGAWDQMETEDALDNSVELVGLEVQTLEYGQILQAEYQNDPRREVSKALGDIYALLAYENPLDEPQVSYLLDRKGRITVAEELNSAILCE
jgi:Ran-binding protein 9/10